MKYKRKHAEVINAWLVGKSIQWLNCDHRWEDLDENNDYSPMTDPDLTWRVKPEEPQTFAYHIPYPRINEVELIGVEKGNGVLIIKYKLKE